MKFRKLCTGTAARIAVTMVVAGLLAVGTTATPSSAAVYKPGDRIDSPATLPITWNAKINCGTPALELALALNHQLDIELYTPWKGEIGFVDHDLVKVALDWFIEWAKGKNIDLSTAAKAEAAVMKAVADDAFLKELRARAEKHLAGRGGVLVPTAMSGNNGSLQIWCLAATTAHGVDFGYFWVPKNGDPLWIGACVFPGGVNFVGYDKNFATGNLTQAVWVNSPPPDDRARNQYIYVYKYDVTNNILVKEKIYGTWKNGPPWTFTASGKVERQTFSPAPSDFAGLKLGGGGGCGCGGDGDGTELPETTSTTTDDTTSTTSTSTTETSTSPSDDTTDDGLEQPELCAAIEPDELTAD